MDYIVSDIKQEKKQRLIAIIITTIFHVLLLLFFFFAGLKHQVPPPPEYGIEVDMSGGGGGGGGSGAQIASVTPTPNPSSSARENISTQDVEESTTINTSRNPVRQQPTTQVTPVENQQQTPTQTVNTNALFPGRNTTSGSTSGSGSSGGSGGGTGTGYGTGTGNGTGSGSGSGSGSGTGKGHGSGTGDFFLNGRPVMTKEYPKAKNNLEGVVIVEFLADRDGNVISAKAGGRGTTINDSQIWKECESAAMRSKFKAKADAQAEERGRITYKFVLQ